jgi:hypothetical protein
MWIETYSMLVEMAYKSSNLVPWSLSNRRWYYCMNLARNMNISVSHFILRDFRFSNAFVFASVLH